MRIPYAQLCCFDDRELCVYTYFLYMASKTCFYLDREGKVQKRSQIPLLDYQS